MICKNCSAEYDDLILSCPYCGSENRKAAEELKEEILEGYDKEAEEIRDFAREYPEKTAKKWTKKLVSVFGVLILVGFAAGMLAIPIGKISVGIEHRSRQKHLEKLEKLYLAGEYEKMDEYLDDKDLYSGVYDKYSEVARVQTQYRFLKNDIQYVRDVLDSNMTAADKKSHATNWCEDILEDAAKVLRLSEEFSQDKKYLGNEDVLESFYAQITGMLTGFGYTEEEIQRISQIKEGDIPEELLEKLLVFYSV